jgi:hypothetical protein
LVCGSEKPLMHKQRQLWPACVSDPETSVQAEEEAEPRESENQESLDPDTKPVIVKRKTPQVRPWDMGKEGVNEGKLVVYFYVALLLCVITSYMQVYMIMLETPIFFHRSKFMVIMRTPSVTKYLSQGW